MRWRTLQTRRALPQIRHENSRHKEVVTKKSRQKKSPKKVATKKVAKKGVTTLLQLKNIPPKILRFAFRFARAYCFITACKFVGLMS